MDPLLWKAMCGETDSTAMLATEENERIIIEWIDSLEPGREDEIIEPILTAEEEQMQREYEACIARGVVWCPSDTVYDVR